jgi:hypothetical protein
MDAVLDLALAGEAASPIHSGHRPAQASPSGLPAIGPQGPAIVSR